MDVPPLPRTLILDYYDSYTNNLLTLFTQLYSDAEVLRKVVVVKADRYAWDEFQRDVLPDVDCIILSPGPGSPDKPEDIGFALDLIRAHPVPILGVCLGHQAIGVAFGAKIANIPQITHGHVVPVSSVRPPTGLFASPIWSISQSEDRFNVVVYNSLTVDPSSLPAELEVTAWSVPVHGRPRTIQGLAHTRYPIWGVQYHPESISSSRGRFLLHAYIDAVHKHHAFPRTYPPLTHSLKSSCAYRILNASKPARKFPHYPLDPTNVWPTPPISPATSHSSHEHLDSLRTTTTTMAKTRALKMVENRFGDVGRGLKTQDMYERVIRSRKGKERAIGEVWLDGESPSRPTTTSLAGPSFLMTYSVASRTVTLHSSAGSPRRLILDEDETFWDSFSIAQKVMSASTNSSSSGWKGGWVGWFGYEMKEESLQGYRRRPPKTSVEDEVEEVDACWAWADWVLERKQDGEWVLRGVLDNQRETRRAESGQHGELVDWLDTLGIHVGLTIRSWDALSSEVEEALMVSDHANLDTPAISFPRFHPLSKGEIYRSRIDDARESIRQGDSYELTLTTSFRSTLPPTSDPYALYLRLRAFNPAYYSAFISFPTLTTPRGKGLHVVSSSPERFLKIERVDEGRRVEMMPIKGTKARVKPGQCVCSANTGCGGKQPGNEACVEEGKKEDDKRAKELQADLKERAENLMIVDLIRSDLLSCCLPSTVTVPKLIALESYGVHHLVTTVQGLLAENVGSVEAVRRCFPPGSMTGAPKLRSVQLLEGYEDGRRRGIYSGALGYISVDGATDLSVVIRTMAVEGNVISLGAGGAITWLSDPMVEWDEVLTKVQSVVGPLEDV